MSTLTTDRRLTPEEFLASPDYRHMELVGGCAVEKSMGALASIVAVRLGRRLSAFVEETAAGWVFDSECAFQCYPWEPTQIRRPDLAYVSRQRMAPEDIPSGAVRLPPDLAVEVVSPTDAWYELEVKAREYLRAGTREVWIVSPASRSVRVYRGTRQEEYLSEEAELTGGDVLPGFHCPVADLFPEMNEAT